VLKVFKRDVILYCRQYDNGIITASALGEL